MFSLTCVSPGRTMVLWRGKFNGSGPGMGVGETVDVMGWREWQPHHRPHWERNLAAARGTGSSQGFLEEVASSRPDSSRTKDSRDEGPSL